MSGACSYSRNLSLWVFKTRAAFGFHWIQTCPHLHKYMHRRDLSLRRFTGAILAASGAGGGGSSILNWYTTENVCCWPPQPSHISFDLWMLSLAACIRIGWPVALETVNSPPG